MRTIGVIPARFASTRFPGKPLKLISGKPLLAWVIEGVKKSSLLDEVCVATDHQEIVQLANDFGAEAVLTDSDLPSGSDRVWAAVKDKEVDLVINIQGDEPLVEGSLIDSLIQPFFENKKLEMATLGRSLDENSLRSSNTAKIVLDSNDYALYFSRFPIPYSRVQPEEKIEGALKHLGIYAYKKEFLKAFCNQPVTEIEKFEGLEQLRALYLGCKIKVIRTDHDSWGVDTPEDVGKVERLLMERKKSAKP
jgi:3-deoxy-manno-octulosonate cytidylyltransferase (CMP-KDO synthetase)